MGKILRKRSRMSHLLHVDYDMESRVPLWYVWFWRLSVEIVSVLSQLFSRVTAESEVSLDDLNQIIIAKIWEVAVAQS